jgi:hypothetical protein
MPVALIEALIEAVSAGITLATKIWDATPDSQKAQIAGDWATMQHNNNQTLIWCQQQLQKVFPLS